MPDAGITPNRDLPDIEITEQSHTLPTNGQAQEIKRLHRQATVLLEGVETSRAVFDEKIVRRLTDNIFAAVLVIGLLEEGDFIYPFEVLIKSLRASIEVCSISEE